MSELIPTDYSALLGDIKQRERQLEQALIANVESFLREMSGAFTFAGS